MLMVVMGLSGGLSFAGDSVSGAQLPESARKVAENRFRSPQDFEGTLKFYKSTYPPSNYPRRSIVNQPGVKGIHIVNPSGRGWEGLNIYEANDEVRIYVVPAEDVVKKKPIGKK
jgi:hypothetical protein